MASKYERIKGHKRGIRRIKGAKNGGENV